MRIRLRNPYLTSYLGFALLCCMALSLLFLQINLSNIRRSEASYNQEKVSLIARDLETQLETFRKIGLKLSVSKFYQPFYFERNKYYESELLDDFSQYRNHAPLIEEYFLSYPQKSKIFHSEGASIGLDTYLEQFESGDALKIRQLLKKTTELSFYPAASSLLVFIPVTITNGSGQPVLCLRLSYDTLMQRFQTVSGGLDGDFILFSGDQLLYASAGLFPLDDEQVLNSVLPENIFHLYVQPKARLNMPLLLPLQLLLLAAMIAFILCISSLFAHRAYKPLRILDSKIRKRLSAGNDNAPHSIKEFGVMMDQILEESLTTARDLEQKQNSLKNQLLVLLLNGSLSIHAPAEDPSESREAPLESLEQAGLKMPGPCFFVSAFSFPQKTAEEKRCAEQLRGLFENLTSPVEDVYIYSLIDSTQNTVLCVCSVQEQEQMERLFDEMQELSESFGRKPPAGCGNLYASLQNIPASWLEALDNMNRSAVPAENSLPSKNASAAQPDLSLICSALSRSDQDTALSTLHAYLAELEKQTPSLLFQQYQFSMFFTELTRFLREHQLQASSRVISLCVSSKNIAQFQAAAEALIAEACEAFSNRQQKMASDRAFRIYQYVNEHFADYNLSLESAAAALSTDAGTVREAIRAYTGKTYKDYLIFLRIEYAKKLLCEDNLTVAETCQRVGYGNISYFIKAFKSLNGVTPAVYKSTVC